MEQEFPNTINFNQELPIKSNQTFLYEWWKIFFETYSDTLLKNFRNNNQETENNDNMNKIDMNMLFQDSFFAKNNVNNGLFSLFQNITSNNNNDFCNPLNLGMNYDTHNFSLNQINSYNNVMNPLQAYNGSLSNSINVK